ncbi:MAG: GerMN domain-containing protein [Halothece sp. Uz-M2-17]|nr:GerMN domain-containing protein [Halothece sp. Uz-M2-17]
MQEQKKGYQFSTGLIAGVSSVLIIAGGFAAWWAWTAIKGEQTPPWVSQPTAPEDSNPSENPAEEIEAKVYWLKVTDNKIELAARPMVVEQAQNSVVVEKALTQLLSGTEKGDYTSTIPEATQLRGLSFQNDGIHVDLSEEFTLGGGSTSMMGRVAQILYTATSLDPEAKVWLEVEGEPLEYLGGEGLYIPQPLTRDEFQANYQF